MDMLNVSEFFFTVFLRNKLYNSSTHSKYALLEVKNV